MVRLPASDLYPATSLYPDGYIASAVNFAYRSFVEDGYGVAWREQCETDAISTSRLLSDITSASGCRLLREDGNPAIWRLLREGSYADAWHIYLIPALRPMETLSPASDLYPSGYTADETEAAFRLLLEDGLATANWRALREDWLDISCRLLREDWLDISCRLLREDGNPAIWRLAIEDPHAVAWEKLVLSDPGISARMPVRTFVFEFKLRR